MPRQATVYRPTPSNPNTSAAQSQAEGTTVEDIDKLLDEIDACLEENVLEVLHAYIQKGGE